MTRTVGLTLGKFAPFHKGHQYVIETARAEVDHLIVVVYPAEAETDVPLETRARWIRELHPGVEVIEGIGGPPDCGDTPEIRQKQENFIRGLLGGRAVTHFYCGEFYGAHMSAALGAVDRRVDPERRAVPISGTAIRSDPHRHRAFIAPRVYRDLIENIVVLGAPSTGKTTLCERLAREFETVWMPEYGREYWEAHQVDRRLTPGQLLEIAEEHLRREEKLLLEANRFLFTDTNAITTLQFALHYHGDAPARLRELADQCASRYHRVLVCGDEIPYDDTWDRSGEANRADFQRDLLADLERRGIRFELLRGNTDERVRAVQIMIKDPRRPPAIAT